MAAFFAAILKIKRPWGYRRQKTAAETEKYNGIRNKWL